MNPVHIGRAPRTWRQALRRHPSSRFRRRRRPPRRPLPLVAKAIAAPRPPPVYIAPRPEPKPEVFALAAKAVPAIGTLFQAVTTGGELFAEGINLLTGGDDARTIAERQARQAAAEEASRAQIAELRAQVEAEKAATWST